MPHYPVGYTHDVTQNDPLIGRVHVHAYSRERMRRTPLRIRKSVREFEVVAFQSCLSRNGGCSAMKLANAMDDISSGWCLGWLYFPIEKKRDARKTRVNRCSPRDFKRVLCFQSGCKLVRAFTEFMESNRIESVNFVHWIKQLIKSINQLEHSDV